MFSHWHFEFSMARFWAVPVFSNEIWTVWSAYTTADFLAQPGRPHGQTYQHKSPLEDGEIFLYSRSWLVGQRNRCWKMACLPKLRVRISRIIPQNVYIKNTSSVLQLGKVLRVYTSTDTKWLKWIVIIFISVMSTSPTHTHSNSKNLPTNEYKRC